MEISHVPVSKSLGNCEHLYNQMSSESLGEFEKVRTRLRQSHAGGSVHFSWQHFIKDRGLYVGHRTVHQTKLFLHPTDTRGKPRPCLIYDARHGKKKTSTTHCGRVRKVLTEQRRSFIDDKSSEVVLYNPFQTEPTCWWDLLQSNWPQPAVSVKQLFSFWNLLDLKAISVFVTFEELKSGTIWIYIKKKVW